eukprot:6192395-Pleurochrysis_carterae.AAC.7
MVSRTQSLPTPVFQNFNPDFVQLDPQVRPATPTQAPMPSPPPQGMYARVRVQLTRIALICLLLSIVVRDNS